MNIKKIVKFSFFLISILVALIAVINYIVTYQIKDNSISNKHISKLVSLQENMNSLSKDLVTAKNIDMLDRTKESFIEYEKEFEKTKKLFTINEQDVILDKIIPDIHSNAIVKQELQLLYKNEKEIESAFDKSYDLQEEKIALMDKFSLAYPKENQMRRKIEKDILTTRNIKLIHSFGKLEYHSKETLFQKKDKMTLDKWIKNIEEIKNENMIKGLDKYENIVKKVALIKIKIEKIEKTEVELSDKIINIITINRRVNSNIQDKIDEISFNFIDSVHFYILILLGFSILFIIFVSYEVSKNVGLSVDEIEEKVQDGLREIKILNDEIVTTQKEVVFTMGAIGEQRSKETGNHVRRVASYSKLFALYYGLSEEDAEMLKQVSPMHDIGKVAIPDAVLNKPGRFDEEERKIMDTHANLGYEMLKGSNRTLLKMAAIVAKEHHEKWNGSGYPDKKSGEDIHIFGRITAIADVFDALGSERVYKKAWNDEKIFKLFKEEKGEHFDPKLVDIFFDNLDEFLKIREELKDKF